jgi:hypothetical protein
MLKKKSFHNCIIQKDKYQKLLTNQEANNFFEDVDVEYQSIFR